MKNLHPDLVNLINLTRTDRHKGAITFAPTQTTMYFGTEAELSGHVSWLNKLHESMVARHPTTNFQLSAQHAYANLRSTKNEDRSRLEIARAHAVPMPGEKSASDTWDRYEQYLADKDSPRVSAMEGAKALRKSSTEKVDKEALQQERLSEPRRQAIAHAAKEYLAQEYFGTSTKVHAAAKANYEYVADLAGHDERAVAHYGRSIVEYSAMKDTLALEKRVSEDAVRAAAAAKSAVTEGVDLVESYTPPAQEAPAATGQQYKVWKFGADEPSIENAPGGAT